MLGLSGGAWTTTLVAALDQRIIRSYPVAGSYPIYLRSGSRRDWGDYEQTIPEIYTKIEYLDMYILGSLGVGRKQLQIINQFDACCFAGTKAETYVSLIQARMSDLGEGQFDFWLDSTHDEHKISLVSMQRILDDLKAAEEVGAVADN